MKPILHTLDTGGSGAGLSHYSRYAGCPKRASLQDELKNEPGAETGSVEMHQGTLIHALLQIRDERVRDGESSELNSKAVKFSHGVDDKAWLGAQKYFAEYQKLMPLRDLGLPQALEWGFDSEEMKHNSEIFGVRPFTGRVDKVTLLEEKDIDYICASKVPTYGEVYLEPGLWLVDHKTSKSWSDITIQKRYQAHQATAYMLAWTTIYPYEQCKGFIFNEITCKKDFQVRRVVLPLPTQAQIMALRTFLAGCKTIMDHPELATWPNSSEQNCFAYWRACPYLGTECNRSF